MIRTALFIVGPPGVGKTAVARALLGFPDVRVGCDPKFTIGADGETCAAGTYTGETFDGADTIGYNGVSRWLSFWEANIAPYVELTIFDGDRFSHETALARVALSVRVACLHLTAPAAVLAARRTQRGSKQNASWVKGRETKAVRFAERVPNNFQVSADQPIDQIVAWVREYVAGYLPTDEQCFRFICGEDDSGEIPADLVRDFPLTHAYLESEWE